MFRTGPVKSKDPTGEMVSIQSAFEQVHAKNEAKVELQRLQAEVVLLQQKAEAPLKRKQQAQDVDMQPVKKKAKRAPALETEPIGVPILPEQKMPNKPKQQLI